MDEAFARCSNPPPNVDESRSRLNIFKSQFYSHYEAAKFKPFHPLAHDAKGTPTMWKLILAHEKGLISIVHR
jgi:hypothetical protein